MWHYHDGMGWWMIFMVIFWLVIIGLIIWGAGQITKRRDTDADESRKTDALEIAKRRYARGEISKEEYEQIKKNIS